MPVPSSKHGSEENAKPEAIEAAQAKGRRDALLEELLKEYGGSEVCRAPRVCSRS
jgi:hypothetical protein